jgi:hypothetical protein
MGKQVKLNSGADLDITTTFVDSHRLFMATMKEIESVRLEAGAKSLKELFEMDLGEEALNTFKNLICRLLSSQEIDAALWQCFGRVTYNGVKVTKDTFEPDHVRADYLPVVKEVMVANLAPFTKNLDSLFSGVAGKILSGLRLSSKPTAQS